MYIILGLESSSSSMCPRFVQPKPRPYDLWVTSGGKKGADTPQNTPQFHFSVRSPRLFLQRWAFGATGVRRAGFLPPGKRPPVRGLARIHPAEALGALRCLLREAAEALPGAAEPFARPAPLAPGWSACARLTCPPKKAMAGSAFQGAADACQLDLDQ